MKTKSVTKKDQGTFTYREVLEACKKYFKNNELAATTWMNKYAMKDRAGNFLEKTPDEMHHRMAVEFARIEDNYGIDHLTEDEFLSLSDYGKTRSILNEQSIFELFQDFNYVIPQGSVMASLGNKEVLASLSNCVVLPEINDSYGGIFKTDEQMAQLFKRRCGVGIDISTLRPSGLTVSNSAGTTSGAVSFMERFSNTTREVAQNGRRGALMITIDITHPDAADFIVSKQDLKKITGANISVRLSDKFMEAVKNKTTFLQKWPCESENPEIIKEVDAVKLWNSIIKCAHKTGEPGIIFWDRQHYYSTSSVYPEFKNTSTNPCSEIAMQGGDSCRLIALNLYNFVEHPFTDKARFDHEKFYAITYEAQRLMDDLVDLEIEAIDRILKKVKSDPEPDDIKAVEIDIWEKLRKAGKEGRRTGLGFTALADTVAALGLQFDSQNSVEMIDEIMKTKCSAEFDSSIDLAIERGKFEGFDPEIEKTSEFVGMLKDEFPNLHGRMMLFGRRNISISTVAPTGSLSMLAQTSSGIEPVFLLSYKRRRKVNPNDPNAKVDLIDELGEKWEEFTVFHPKLNDWKSTTGMEDIEKSPYAGCTAPEIDWQKRIEIQAIVQKYTTHSISSTINLPSDAKESKVGEIYLESWEHGLKGITVYRDGSRMGVLVSDDKKDDDQSVIIETKPPSRPKFVDAEVIRFMNDNEKWIAVVGLIDNKPYEIFTGKAEDSFYLPNWVEKGWVIKNKTEDGKKRYDFQYVDSEGYKVTIEGLSRSFNEEYWNYAKLISGVLRHGMPIIYVVDLIKNLNLMDETINTWKNGVTRALKKFVPDGTAALDHKCAECGDPDGVIYEEGCLKCKSCGATKCG